MSKAHTTPDLRDRTLYQWLDEIQLGVFVADRNWGYKRANMHFHLLMGRSVNQSFQHESVFSLLGMEEFPVETIREFPYLMTFTQPRSGNPLLLRITTFVEDGTTHFLGTVLALPVQVPEDAFRIELQADMMCRQHVRFFDLYLEGLIHNINSPLNTIIGYTQILQREFPDNKALHKIMESGVQIDNTIKQIHDKIEETKSFVIQPVDVSQLVFGELQRLKNNLFFKHNVELVTSLEPELPLVEVLYSDLSYCLNALLQNALEAMELTEDKRLVVKTLRQAGQIEIRIEDTGIGIEPAAMPFVFEAGVTTKRAGSEIHTGYGLTFARQLIGRYQGRIRIQSNPGESTTASILIPVEE